MNGIGSPQILSWPDALAWRQAKRMVRQTVVLTNGCFDLLHRGHLEYLQRSATLGHSLVVAVNSDASVRALKGPSRPLNSAQDRAYILASLRCVDMTFIFTGPRLVSEIAAFRPDIYTKAGDYTMETLDASERTALLDVGADIKILPFVDGHSTTATIKRMAK